MATLVFRNGPYAGKTLQIPPGKVICMGRNRDIELPLPDLKLSRRHCQIESGMAGYILRDLGSTNGTYLNGQRVSGEVSLRNFDRLLIGDTEIEFQSPEELEDLQTRVGAPEPQKLAAPAGPAATAPVSNALEPVTGATVARTESAAPIPVPVIVQGPDPAVMRELAAALQELAKPLPAEPGSAQPPAAKPQLYFCDQCDGSIPSVDLDLGLAKEISGKLFCKECIGRGVSVGSQGAAAAAAMFTDLAPAAAPMVAVEAEVQQDLDEILKGLDVEEVISDDVPDRAPKVVVKADLESFKRDLGVVGVESPPGGSTRRMRPLTADGEPKPLDPAGELDELDELLGEDLEEIEAPPPVPVAQARPPAKPAPARPAPPKRTSSDDDDLIEIGSSGPA